MTMPEPDVRMNVQLLWDHGDRLIDGKPARRGISLLPVVSREMKQTFDGACALLHYAGACKRVGRIMRLAITNDGRWAGGIVLGSPFPNLRPRDDAFGLTRYVLDWRERGLISPWASENRAYWRRLQRIVNHARAFVFPQYQGQGVGVQAHRLLESTGRDLWEATYGQLSGFDTLCTDPKSRLFRENGWVLVGRTKGFARDPTTVLSRRVSASESHDVRDNAGLARTEGNYRWWIWVKVLSRVR